MMRVFLRDDMDAHESLTLGDIDLPKLPDLVETIMGSQVWYANTTRAVENWQIVGGTHGPRVEFIVGDEL